MPFPLADALSPALSVRRADCVFDLAAEGTSGGGKSPGAGVARPGDSLPCLSSNNSIEGGSKLSPYQRKNAYSINENLGFVVQKFGLGKIGFLTLTFPKKLSLKEANRRFNSLATNFLDKHFVCWVCIREFTKSGRPHFHLIVVCHEEIREGFNFENYVRMNRLSRTDELRRKNSREIGLLSRSLDPTPALRSLWGALRATLPVYQFGRHELIPVRKSGAALARYVGGYIRKSMDFRPVEAKGARLISYSKTFPRKIVGHAWAFNTDGSRFWRQKVALFAETHGVKDMEGLKTRFGARWAWWFRDVIESYNLFPFLDRGCDERRIYLEGLDQDRIPAEFWDNGGFLSALHAYRPKSPEIDGKPVPPPRRLAPVFGFHFSNWNKSREQIASELAAVKAKISSDRASGVGMFFTPEMIARAKQRILSVPLPSRAAVRAENFTRLVHPTYFSA